MVGPTSESRCIGLHCKCGCFFSVLYPPFLLLQLGSLVLREFPFLLIQYLFLLEMLLLQGHKKCSRNLYLGSKLLLKVSYGAREIVTT